MPQTFSIPIESRFSDLDAYGHVNNAVYFTYLETARVKLFSDYCRYDALGHARFDGSGLKSGGSTRWRQVGRD